MQTMTGFIRSIGPNEEELPADELSRRARACWDSIADETDDRKAHAHRVARLYLVCRDIQMAARNGARLNTVQAILTLIAAVITNAFSLRIAR